MVYNITYCGALCKFYFNYFHFYFLGAKSTVRCTRIPLPIIPTPYTPHCKRLSKTPRSCRGLRSYTTNCNPPRDDPDESSDKPAAPGCGFVPAWDGVGAVAEAGEFHRASPPSNNEICSLFLYVLSVKEISIFLTACRK